MSAFHIRRFIVLCGLASSVQLGVTGCDSADPIAIARVTGPEEEQFEPAMTVSISGSDWVASSAVARDVRIDNDIFLSIQGVAALGDAVTLLLNRPLELKTYVIRGEGLVAQQYRSPGVSVSDVFESSDTGTVTFTFISEKRLQGSFSFDADRVSDSTSISLKGGRFNVEF